MFWGRGDKVDLKELGKLEFNNCTTEVKAFLVDKAEDFLQVKPEDRCEIETFIEELLDLYEGQFTNP